MTTIQNQNFGVEIELMGITRRDAAKVIADYYGTTAAFEGSYYDIYTAKQKETLMLNVLTRRLGMTGAEFKTARYHLTIAFAEMAEAA